VIEHVSVTSHYFWLTSRHAACSTRPVWKVTRGQVMSRYIITIIAVQRFLKNGNTFSRLMIQLPLNKLCLVMSKQFSRHYHAWTHNSPNDDLIFLRVLMSSNFFFLSLAFLLLFSFYSSTSLHTLTDRCFHLSQVICGRRKFRAKKSLDKPYDFEDPIMNRRLCYADDCPFCL
jgi:hypothetical protein